MTAGELAVLMAAVLCCIGFAALIVVPVEAVESATTSKVSGSWFAGATLSNAVATAASALPAPAVHAYVIS